MFMLGRFRTLGLALVAATAIGLAACVPAPQPPAASKNINFEPPYSTGTVRGQDSPPWTGADCGATIDQAVVANSGFAAPSSFGTQSFRLSNAEVSGCFIDAFTPELAHEAGESTAANGGLSGGTRQPYFDASWTFASTTGALQPGLNVQVSPDRGDGARMSFLRMKHTASNLELEFFDVQGVTGTAPCLGCANFVGTPLGTYDPTVPHTVRMTMRFVEGESNDVVQVFVDGALKITGRSWEDYYTMDTESSPTPPRVSRTVDSLLFRASGASAPSLAGQGFLFDDVAVSSGPVPAGPPPSLTPITIHITVHAPPL